MKHDLPLKQMDSGVRNLAALTLAWKFSTPLPKQEKLHKDAYEYHETLINAVEQSSFCPLIFGCLDGAALTAKRTM